MKVNHKNIFFYPADVLNSPLFGSSNPFSLVSLFDLLAVPSFWEEIGEGRYRNHS